MVRSFLKWFAVLAMISAWADAHSQTCFTRCLLGAEFACESGDKVGGCAGFWGCEAQMGAHVCGVVPQDGTLPSGAACSANAQCGSKNCEGKICVCKSDLDCGPKGNCKRPLGGQNYCEGAAILPLGAACRGNSDCRSNNCEKDVCVCKDDADCGANGNCKKPVGGQNYCAASPQGLGASCRSNSECRSNNCEKDVCVCKDDADCGANGTCKKPVGGQNYCAASPQGLGASCRSNSECRSNNCEKDRCVCKDDADCGANGNCKKPLFGQNYCK
jgi:hypothetical protein